MGSGLNGKTIVITGAAGMLGSAFRMALAELPGNRRVLALSRPDLDITDRGKVLALSAERPDLIIHCAAEVNAERCEAEPERCRAIQVEGTRHVADLAAATGARVFYPQSFLIFDGSEAIHEHTVPAPLSVYGRCKLEAERLLRDRLPDSLVVRMAGFFGGCEADKNFVGQFTRRLAILIQQGVPSYDVGDRVWQPTYTLDLARNSLVLLAAGKSGIYTMSTHGEASFHDLAQACVEELGLSRCITLNRVPSPLAAGPERALRPPKAIMVNRRLLAEGLDFQRPWRSALREYLQEPYFQTIFTHRPED